MGNRAVIAFESMPEVGIYLHWNGGPESVLAFLEVAQRRGARSPGGDKTYSFARLAQCVADFFADDGTCVGVGPLSSLDRDNGDNGLYWIGKDWKISRREHMDGARKVSTVEALDSQQLEQYQEVIRRCMEGARAVFQQRGGS